jgi:hypothetical protein
MKYENDGMNDGKNDRNKGLKPLVVIVNSK